MIRAGVGSRMPRVDAAALAAGQTRFTTDVVLPGMLHCRLVFSTHAHARITRVNTAAARALPGVVAVLTASDLPGPVFTGVSISDRPVFAGDTVRSVADVVAAVAAEDEETAERAAALIDVAYEALPAVYTPEDALLGGAPRIHERRAEYKVAPFMRPYVVYDQGNVFTQFRVRRGDVDRGRAAADHVVRGRFRTQRMEHFSMEPHAAVASYEHGTDRLTVWSSTGKPFRTLSQLTAVLGLPMSRVHIVHLPAGGDFGGKGELTIEPYCALLAMRTGRPVKGVFSREDEFVASTCKLPFDTDLAIGIDADGRITFMEAEILTDSGPYNSMPSMLSIHGATHLEGPYDVPNIAVRVRCVATNNVLSGSFRGFGAPQVALARESLLDQAAADRGIDPIELRLRNAWGPGSVTCTGQVLDPTRYSVTVRETLRAAAEKSAWTERRRQRLPGAGRFRRGIGVATAHHGIGGGIWSGADTATAIIKANQDGSLTLVSGASEVGQGATTALIQIVAEELDVPMSQIGVALKDTDTMPFDGGASASRTMYVTGNATRAAAVALRDKLLAIAARMLEAHPADLECRAGRIAVRGASQRSCSLEEVVAFAHRSVGEQPIGTATFGAPVVQLDAEGRGSPFQAFDYATQIVEVEVDVELGHVCVLEVISALDVGRAINPLIVEGQIEGGVVMGLGYALMEEIVCQDGQVMNPHAFDYRIPRAGDVPELTHVILEKADPVGPYGAKGVGEIGMVPMPAAIANAIYDAVGVRVTELPITPERLLLALRAGEG
ncbi:MAG TPA: xanthine dehydrogenase family protein molybdopterin-binding subunit [bacterium]|nr:xanthine dehydrogenase family protein molybdopterin-binding subunit [bacterium]